MAVGEKSEDPQNISAGLSERRSENENGPAPSIATGVGTSINTSCKIFSNCIADSASDNFFRRESKIKNHFSQFLWDW